MRYAASEKLEIIRIVDQWHLPAKPHWTSPTSPSRYSTVGMTGSLKAARRLWRIDTSLPDPELRMNLIDEHGNCVRDPLILKATDLTNGLKSWPENMDEISRRRVENILSGKDYFAPD